MVDRPTRRLALLWLALTGIWKKYELSTVLGSTEAIAAPPKYGSSISLANQKKVIAHWHFFPISIDNNSSNIDYYAKNYLSVDGERGKFAYCGGFIRERPFPRRVKSSTNWQTEDLLTDIILASSISIDAFQYNISSLDPLSSSWRRLIAFLEACRLSKKPFKIMPCLDCTAITGRMAEDMLANALLSIADHECVFRDSDGKIVLSFFLPDRIERAAWVDMLAKLRIRKLSVKMLFMFLDWNIALNRPDLLGVAAYIMIWSGNYKKSLDALDRIAEEVKRLGKKWVSPIWPQDFRAKDSRYVEARNSELFREGWRRVIENGAEFVNLLTWNDYSEGSEIRPSTSINYAFYDLAGYFIKWFKQGGGPAISRDILYYFHRVQIIGGTKLMKQKQEFVSSFGLLPSNDIELVCFLVSPGRIEIEIGGEVAVFSGKSGVSSFRVPSRNGRPIFRLIRDERTIISVMSEFEIVSFSDYQDLLYHGGSSDRVN